MDKREWNKPELSDLNVEFTKGATNISNQHDGEYVEIDGNKWEYHIS